MSTSKIIQRLNARHTSNGWEAHCPAHDDRTASLSIKEGHDGRTLLHCHAGCTTAQIVAALNLKISDLFPPRERPARARIVKTYDYQDAAGKLLFQVVRLEPKGFRQRRPDPDRQGQWLWNMNGITRVLYRLPQVIEAVKAGQVIYVVEGEKDADALVKLSLCATCNPGGAGKWMDSYTATLAGAKVVVIADRDEAGKKHAALVSTALHGKATSIKVIELSDRNGHYIKDAADWISTGGTVDEFLAIVSNTSVWKVQDRRAITSPANGVKGGRPGAPAASQVAYAFADAKLRTPAGFLIVRHYRDTWYRFANGWRPVTDLEMEKAVITFLQDDLALATFATTNYARNILRNLASFNLCGLDARIDMPCWLSTNEDARDWIAFSNGIAVNIWNYATQLVEGRTPENCTRPVSPDLFSSDFVDYPWDDSGIPEKFLAYLERVQPDPENFNAIRRMMGLLLADVQKYEVFYQLFGNGANGKTVLLDLIEALLGQENVCRVPLESLAPGTRFQTWPLSVSKVNICGEIATDLGSGALAAIEGAFKHCVSGGVIEVEHKGRDKTTARCRSRFVMSGNSLPTFIDRSNAIWRRLRIIPFGVDLPLEEQDSDLAKKIISDEMPAVCTWALDGLAEIIRASRVDECSAGVRLAEKHRMDCDHERQFLTEKFAAGMADDRLPSSEIYTEYKAWMLDNGYRSLGAGKFFTRLEAFFPCAESKVLRIEGNIFRGVTGLKRR